MKHFSPKSKGFTLLELMVVVGIVGILTKIGTTVYSRSVSKARQMEAKLALSAIYSAEMTYFSEFYSYSPCLRQMGYVPDSANRYYLVGFSYESVLNNDTCGPDGTKPCKQYKVGAPYCNAGDPNHLGWPAPLTNSDIAYSSSVAENIGMYYNRPLMWHLNAPGIPTEIHSQTFLAGAAGAISSKPVNTAMKGQPYNVNSGAMADGWSINERKQLINNFPGI